jgi:hypothetical protein
MGMYPPTPNVNKLKAVGRLPPSSDDTVAQGPIMLTSVSFGDFAVANQALSKPGAPG